MALINTSLTVQSGFFLQIHEILAILPTLYSHIFAVSYFIHTHPMIIINVKLDVSRYGRITFQRSRLHCSSLFVMAQPK